MPSNVSETADGISTAVLATLPYAPSVQTVAISANGIDYVGNQPPVRFKYYTHALHEISPTGGPRAAARSSR